MHKKKGWFCNHLQELAQADAVERHRAREKESVGFLWDFCRFFCLRRLCQERKREEMIILAKRHEVHQHRIHAVSILSPGHRCASLQKHTDRRKNINRISKVSSDNFLLNQLFVSAKKGKGRKRKGGGKLVLSVWGALPSGPPNIESIVFSAFPSCVCSAASRCRQFERAGGSGAKRRCRRYSPSIASIADGDFCTFDYGVQ